MIIDCKSYADSILDSLTDKIKTLEQRPFLAGIRIANNPASESYAAGIKKDCARCGIFYAEYIMNTNDSYTWDKRLTALNADPAIDGIIVFHPTYLKRERIAQEKDVDAFHSDSFHNNCTAEGVVELLAHNGVQLLGKHVVVIGRSKAVGRPIAMTCLDNHATVTICHTGTKLLASHCRSADVIISATGIKNLVTGDMIKPGAVVIDVGRGDVDIESVEPIAKAVTPAAGGTGLVTRAILLRHVVKRAEQGEI